MPPWPAVTWSALVRCTLGITSTWHRPCGSMSRIARAVSALGHRADGISPATILQKRHSLMCCSHLYSFLTTIERKPMNHSWNEKIAAATGDAGRSPRRTVGSPMTRGVAPSSHSQGPSPLRGRPPTPPGHSSRRHPWKSAIATRAGTSAGRDGLENQEVMGAPTLRAGLVGDTRQRLSTFVGALLRETSGLTRRLTRGTIRDQLRLRWPWRRPTRRAALQGCQVERRHDGRRVGGTSLSTSSPALATPPVATIRGRRSGQSPRRRERAGRAKVVIVVTR